MNSESRRRLANEFYRRAFLCGDEAVGSSRYDPNLVPQQSAKFAHEVFQFVRDSVRGKRVGEFGAGNGRITELLAGEAGEVVAIDISEPMLAKNRERLGTNASKVDYRCEFAQDTKDFFDSIVCCLVMIHQVTDEMFREMVRALCHSTFDIFLIENVELQGIRREHTYVREERVLVSAFASHGFSVVARREYVHFQDRMLFLHLAREHGGETRQAVLLAGGRGTRLGAEKGDLPKVMLPVAGKPLIERLIAQLRDTAHVHDVLIHLHHRGEAIRKHFSGGLVGVRFRYYDDPELPGTAGALKRFGALLRPAPFIVACGDVVTDAGFGELWDAHLGFNSNHNALATIALFERGSDMGQCGNVEIESGKVTRFVEKPPGGPVSSRALANGGVYVIQPELLDRIQHTTCLSRHQFPELARDGLLYGLKMDGQLYLVDTPVQLHDTQRRVTK